MSSSTITTPDAAQTAEPAPHSPRRLTLGQVRAAFSPRCYERSTARALLTLAFDLALYTALIAAAIVVANPVLTIGFGVLAGFAVAFAFVWGHDAAHGALFDSDRVSEVLGTIAMLPSLNMYRLWVFGHNKVHHGFTSLSTIDWIWRPWTIDEYRAASRWSRLVYRLERHPVTCALHYLLRVWWQGMVRFRPDPRARRTRGVGATKVITLAYALGLGTVAWLLGGPVAAVAAVVVPFVVFTWFIAFFVYLHHTHPDVAFYDERREWSALDGQLRSSITIRCNPVWEHLTHHILVHTPHHVDTRIPFYRLAGASADLAAVHGDEITTYRFRWRTVRHIFRTCKLYDFTTHRWSGFEAATTER
ncbi:MAG: fatty acid desaturase [Acidimicrobiales bacterium]|nr:fatty acid desaturase [Acidimicrobiales bacterium]